MTMSIERPYLLSIKQRDEYDEGEEYYYIRLRYISHDDIVCLMEYLSTVANVKNRKPLAFIVYDWLIKFLLESNMSLDDIRISTTRCSTLDYYYIITELENEINVTFCLHGINDKGESDGWIELPLKQLV